MSKKLKRKSMRWLHFIHIVSISVWFGAVISIGVLAVLAFFQLNESDFLIVMPLIPMLYQKIILPIALFTIVQGIIYGFFTNWGFLKFKWIFLKWCLVLLIALCTGLGAISHIFVLLDRVKTFGFVGGFADGGLILLFIFLQVLFMLSIFILSVFKPLNQKKTV